MALDFDGTDDDVTIGDVAAIDITGELLSLSCWFNPDVISVDQFLIGKRDLGTSVFQYGLYLSGANDVGFEIGSGATVRDSRRGTVNAGTWQQAGGVFLGTSDLLTAWYNGTPDSTPTSTATTIGNSAMPLKIGEAGTAAADNDFPFNGKICEVGIWDVALSDGEMKSLAKGVSPLLIRRNSLKGYWPLWSSAHLMDLSGNGNAGSLTGAVTYAHAPVIPLLFGDEHESYVVAGAAPSASLGGPMLLGVG